MNLFFLSKDFVKQVSLWGVAAWIGCPQIANAEGMVVESGTMNAVQQKVEAKVLCMMLQGFLLLVHQW